MDHRIGSVSQKWNVDLVHTPSGTIAGCTSVAFQCDHEVRKNDEKNSYVVVYFKENWRSAEHKQN